MHQEIFNATQGSVIATRARRAASMLSRARGLMFVGSFPEGSGLIIDPCSSIHMFWMKIPLDVLYLDSSDTIVRAQRAIRPWRIGPLRTRGARYVIELPVGTIDRSGCQVGDVVTFRDCAMFDTNGIPKR
jgi:uncharacterized protein